MSTDGKAIDRFRKFSGCMLECLNEETAVAVAGLPADLPDPEIREPVNPEDYWNKMQTVLINRCL